MQQKQKIDQPYRVSVRLANAQSKFYYVMGAVTTQGRFPIKGNETVLDAILQAGLKSNSLPEKAYLVRPHPPGSPTRFSRSTGAASGNAATRSPITSSSPATGSWSRAPSPPA